MSEPIPAAKRERTTPGEMLHGYRVRKWLGDGAFSVVYLVEDPKTHVQYALKHVISEGDKEDRYLDQLRMEWEVGRRLKHRNIRDIVDMRGDQGFKIGGVGLLKKPGKDLGLVMEMIDAPSLEDLLQKGELRFSVPEWITIFRDVASALVHIQDKGYAHADMKPNNILWDRNHTKVIDLGQACAVGTVKKRIQGTPGYIAPEQAFRNEITPLTDVYNFGATLYWVLVRDEIPCALPSKNGKVGSAVNPDQIRMPRPVHEQDPRIPAGFNEIVMQCIRVAPEARFQSMEMVAERLDALADHCHSTGAGNALAGLQTSTGAPDRAYDSEPSKAG